MTQPRFKRPVPHRTQPERGWSGLWGGPPIGEADPRPADDSLPFDHQVVNGAYSVVDDYLRQGQRLAEKFWLPLTPTQTEGFDGLAERFMHSAVDLSSAWLEMMQQWMPSTAYHAAPVGSAGPFVQAPEWGTQTPSPGSSHFPAAPPPPASEPIGSASSGSVSVLVESSQRTRVTVDLHRGIAAMDLLLGPLVAAVGEAPSIRGVEVETDRVQQQIDIRLRIPDGQPSGIYNGVLVDRTTHRPRGTVTVEVGSAS